MGKTIAIIGTINNKNVQDYIVNEVNRFCKQDFSFKQLPIIANSYVTPIDDKINAEAINKYIEDCGATNLNLQYKIGIITNFELVSILNQNKLLKTFEDNPENTLQIIIVNRENSLISTIKSRMLIVDLRQENLEYQCLDKEREFYQTIIKSQKEVNYLAENPEIKQTLLAIEQALNTNNVTSAYILYTNKLTTYNQLINNLVVRMLFNYLYQTQQIKKLRDLFAYEERFSYGVNERLQVEALFVEVKGAINE